MNRKFTPIQNGFTIVELIIVVVIIGILSSITVVAYNGAQNRAKDTSVQSDLRNISDQFEVFYGLNGRYPNSAAELESIDLEIGKSAYAISPAVLNNLIPCVTAGSSEFTVMATSKSGKRFYIKGGDIGEYTGAVSWSGAYSSAMCISTGLAASDAITLGIGYTSAGSWSSWTKDI